MGDLLDTLVRGPGSVRVTFVEGLRREEMARVFAEAIKTPTAYTDFLAASSGEEGFLFPDTYFVPQKIKAADMVSLLKQTASEKMTVEMQKSFDQQGLTLRQAVTLASLIEREAITSKDRALVAGVLLNRLNNDWPLDIDASVQYVVGSSRCGHQPTCDWWPRKISATDLKTASPYNTYTVRGLPPTPICNPSLSALQVVASPTKSDYYFYISDAKGTLHFAKTLEEHNANIAKYL